MASVQIEGVGKQYGGRKILAGLSLEINDGECFTLLGPSGCGKTVLLRLIAGFELPDAGRIAIGGETVASATSGLALAPDKRGLGVVFQDYAVWPHMSVFANVAYPLKLAGTPAVALRERTLAAIEIVGLAGLEQRMPSQLSGGQQQRVALARALAPRPQLILLDEPFSNLDVELRERLSLEVRHILKQEGCTAILVTHDQQEAFAMADEIGIMWQGKIRQWASPSQLYHHPANRFVAGFIGQGAFLSGESIGKQQLRLETGDLLHCPRFPEAGQRVEILIRPDEIVPDARSAVQAKVIHRVFRGAQALYTLRLAGGSELLWLAPSHEEYRIGEALGIRFNIRELNAFEG